MPVTIRCAEPRLSSCVPCSMWIRALRGSGRARVPAAAARRGRPRRGRRAAARRPGCGRGRSPPRRGRRRGCGSPACCPSGPPRRHTRRRNLNGARGLLAFKREQDSLAALGSLCSKDDHFIFKSAYWFLLIFATVYGTALIEHFQTRHLILRSSDTYSRQNYACPSCIYLLPLSAHETLYYMEI